VPADSLDPIALELSHLGSSVDWWREDHPAERRVSAYLLDPDGNRVQLVPSSAEDLARHGFLDHVGVVVHDLESTEVFYEKVLGGRVDYYHGRRAQDYQEALAWEEGADPCAPWTRLWPGAGLSTDPRHKARAPHPNQQVFLRFGESRLTIVLDGKHRQEPPEEQAIGTPRIVFRSPLRAATIGERLASPPFPLSPEDRLPLVFQVDGAVIYLRDPGGNFVQVDSADTV
jgi:catechol 2,3-dioxygenase-like lactoylglutathione lyase family enzyme